MAFLAGNIDEAGFTVGPAPVLLGRMLVNPSNHWGFLPWDPPTNKMRKKIFSHIECWVSK